MAGRRDKVAAFYAVNDTGGVYQAATDAGGAVLLEDYSLNFTDIAVSPSGEVYANTFGALYRLDLSDGSADFVLGFDAVLQANGLAFDASGKLYVSYGESRSVEIYDGKTFAELDSFQIPGSPSAGDMHIVGSTLYYAARDETLRTVNLNTQAQTGDVFHDLPDLFGLHRHEGTLYALSGVGLYEIDPSDGAVTFIRDLPISGRVNGAATLPDGVQKGSGAGERIEALFAGAEVKGFKGADTLVAAEGGSALDGGKGSDTLLGKAGDDALQGGAGKDKLRGKGGRDEMDGGAGKDDLDGDAGRDALNGGRGNDALTGGAGRDWFEFGRKAGRDVVTDWRDGQDKLRIEAGADRFAELEFKAKRKYVDVDFGEGVARLMGAELDELSRSDFAFA
ncbi:MAG: hypothetical protein AAF192_09650 [Pseudomonadota bacterium]